MNQEEAMVTRMRERGVTVNPDGEIVAVDGAAAFVALPRTCSVAGCEGAGPYRRRLCSRHYFRWLRHGSATAVPLRWGS